MNKHTFPSSISIFESKYLSVYLTTYDWYFPQIKLISITYHKDIKIAISGKENWTCVNLILVNVYYT